MSNNNNKTNKIDYHTIHDSAEMSNREKQIAEQMSDLVIKKLRLKELDDEHAARVRQIQDMEFRGEMAQMDHEINAEIRKVIWQIAASILIAGGAAYGLYRYYIA